MTIRVMPIYGTRPEAIKMAPIVNAIDSTSDFAADVVVTGQHREMLSQVNATFGIRPFRDLDVFAHGQGLNEVASRTLERLTPILQEFRPDLVLVQGDTTSAFASGLAAFYQKIPVAHVEAGLRTTSIWSPFPEEANRRLLTQISTLHLAPTSGSKENLLAEGVDPGAIVVTGNSVIDAFQSVARREHCLTVPGLVEKITRAQKTILVTSHRRESWGAPMNRIATAVARIAVAEPDALIVLPLHANPVVRGIFRPTLSGLPNVVLTEPLDYPDFARLTAMSTLVVTDSGGVQEEAPSIGKPVLVIREETERPDAIAAGTARLVGTDEDNIVAEVTTLLQDQERYQKMARAVNPYGDGRAAQRTVAALREFFGIGERLPDFAP